MTQAVYLILNYSQFCPLIQEFYLFHQHSPQEQRKKKEKYILPCGLLNFLFRLLNATSEGATINNCGFHFIYAENINDA